MSRSARTLSPRVLRRSSSSAPVRTAPAGSGRGPRHSNTISTTGRRALLALIVVLLTASLASAQNATAQPATPRPKPCSAPEYRQFDFWVGEWEVWTERLRKNGGPPAQSRITVVEKGCVIQEEYTTPSGYSGRSLNYYDKRDGKWHQTWIDNGGNPILQVGGMQGESMVLDAPGPDGSLGRITWTPMEDGKVRQHWTNSKDGGKTWTTVFDGMYHPKKK